MTFTAEYVADCGPKFWAKVDRTPGCWLWRGTVAPDGYGRIWDTHVGRSRKAHRMAWAHLNGPVPDGLQLDHLCRVRACVRPDHLEAVTARVNTLRSESPSAVHARQVECGHGHPFDEANTYRWRGARACRACNRAAAARYKAGTWLR